MYLLYTVSIVGYTCMLYQDVEPCSRGNEPVELCDATERLPSAHKTALDYCQTLAHPVLYICKRNVRE